MVGKLIWAPWRSAFILGKKEKGCIFCRQLRKKDSVKNLVLYRGRKVCAIMNKYPYNTGHTMVLPVRHIGLLERLSTEEATEFFELTRRVTAAMKKAIKPHGFNLGMNLGRSAGAGVPGHLHMHIVPRWTGDTNFMPIVGKTDVISIPLEPVYERLKKALCKG